MEYNWETAQHIGGHGILGGSSNVAMGGKFQDGFLTAAASAGAGDFVLLGDPHATGGAAFASRTIRAGAVGGTVSVLGGGKFANGAYTAAFQHLLNAEAGWKRHLKNLAGSAQKTLKWATGFGGNHDVHHNDSFADAFRNADYSYIHRYIFIGTDLL